MHPISARRKSSIVALILVVAMLLTSAGLAGSEDKGLKRLAEPRQAPGFELPGVDGRVHRLEEYRGRYLLVNFWAVWCPPCLKEMPSMQRAYGSLKSDRFELLAVHAGPSLEDAMKFVDEHGLSFPVVVDQSMNLGVWQVLGLPTTFLVDPQGRIVAEAVGDRPGKS
jgi:peroxiredoxin